MTLLAIDPGADSGWATFGSAGTLEACGLGDYSGGASAVIVECPYVYPRSPVDPNGLIVLARHVGRIEERYGKVALVFPRQWKGTVPKEIHNARVLDRLSLEELSLYQASTRGVCASKKHNVIDAIGLGKWALREGPWRQSTS